MPDHDVACPFCRKPIPVEANAGFAYGRTKVVGHLESCDCRPPELDYERYLGVADNLVARIFLV